MKNHFNKINHIELIEDKPLEKHSIKERFVFKSLFILRHLLIKETPIAGYGHCRSCDCKGYISKHNGSHECKNCNHHYDRHN